MALEIDTLSNHFYWDSTSDKVSTVSEKLLASPAPVQTPEEEDVTSYQEKMFKLYAKVLQDISMIMQFMSKNMGLQSQISDASIRAAEGTEKVIDKKLDEMEAEQSKIELTNKILKGLGIAMVVISILTCNPEIAPASAALTVGTSAVVVSGGFDQNGYVTKGLIEPVSKGLQSIGIPQAASDILAKLIVISAIAAGGAAAGAKADGAFASARGNAVSNAGRFSSTGKMILSQEIAATGVVNDLLSKLPMKKSSSLILSTLVSVVISAYLSHSAGRGNLSKPFSQENMMASLRTSVQVVNVSGQIAQTSMTFQQAQVRKNLGKTIAQLADANASFTEIDAWGKLNGKNKTTSDALKQAADQIQTTSQSMGSINQPAEATIRALKERR